MSNYLLAYTGGQMAETEAERNEAMAAWGAWFEKLGPAIVDAGNPFGASTAVAAAANGDGAPSGLTGYSIVSADNLGAAAELAQDCPVLNGGGNVEVYETIEVM